MKTLPELLIVTDRGHFIAYRGHAEGRITALDAMDIPESLEKLSDQVTDKAGGFSAMESMGQGNSSAERLPLEAELELRAIRKIGQRIGELIDEHSIDTWGLVAAPEIHGAIIDQLPPLTRDKLVLRVKKNLNGQTPEELLKRLAEA